jgi:NIMA (never in mitosis gene a)-related kinase 1/4/5
MDDSLYGSNSFIPTDPQQDYLMPTPNDNVSIVNKFMRPCTTLDDFNILQKLGEGSYSTVYKCLRKADNKVYSLKKVRIMDGLSDKERDNSINEVRILASIKNNINVVRYYEAFMDTKLDSEQFGKNGPKSTYLCIVMEYADNGDLF